MAQFYGSVQGRAGEVHRLGTKDSGITVTAASYDGAIRVTMAYDRDTEQDMFWVQQTRWQGAGVSQEIAYGPVGALLSVHDRRLDYSKDLHPMLNKVPMPLAEILWEMTNRECLNEDQIEAVLAGYLVEFAPVIAQLED